MAAIMTKRGSQDNVITYEFMCESAEDMASIDRKYITLGSICIIVNDGAMDIYIADSAHEWHSLSIGANGGSGDAGASLSIYICANNEVSNGLPNISEPDENTIYLVASGNTSGNLYEEYIYVNNAWEKFGAASIDLSGYAPIANPEFTGSISLGRKANTTIGTGSTAIGINTEASGDYSHAEGYGATASGHESHAEGSSTVASGAQAHTEGSSTTASGAQAHAEGSGCQATAASAHAEGYNTSASANCTHTEGAVTYASAYNAHAEGNNTRAAGPNAHAEGNGTYAASNEAHAEGLGNELTAMAYDSYITTNPLTRKTKSTSNSLPGATGPQSHTEGYKTIAGSTGSHSEGYLSVCRSYGGHTEGYNTLSDGGNGCHAEGMYTYASGANSTHAEGRYTLATGGGANHAEGDSTIANGQGASHAEGLKTESLGYASHTEGIGTLAQEYASGGHAEGTYTMVSAEGAHAEGYGGSWTSEPTTTSDNVTAINHVGPRALSIGSHAEGGYTLVDTDSNFAHAEGEYTVAGGRAQHVGGKYNVKDALSLLSLPTWTANTSYAIGDKVKYIVVNTPTYRICKEANSDAEFDYTKWDFLEYSVYAEIIGNGTADNARSNARALDWDGNEYLKGDLYVGCNVDSTGGTKVATESFVTTRVPAPPVADGTYNLQVVVSSGTATYSWVAVSDGANE